MKKPGPSLGQRAKFKAVIKLINDAVLKGRLSPYHCGYQCKGEDIGREIYLLRLAAQMTEEEFAKKVGSTRQHIHAVEDNQSAASLKMLNKIAKAFGLKVVVTFVSEDSVVPSAEEIALRQARDDLY